MPLSRIQQLLEEKTGLDLASLGHQALEHAIRDRMRQSGCSNREDYWQRLRGCPTEQQELVECLRVPETWFFRDAPAFATLIEWIKKIWLPQHPRDHLRLLSAACSTGEEPYSMAIALLEAGISPDRFHVDAWDISPQALAKAERAFYGRNSFRSNSRTRPGPFLCSESNGYSVCPSVRNQVRFRQANLLSAPEPVITPVYAAVFCRNVMIYFTPRAREKVLANLTSLVFPAGLLFVGPAETGLLRQHPFQPWGALKAFAFQRTNHSLGVDRNLLTAAPGLREKAVKVSGFGHNRARKDRPLDSSQTGHHCHESRSAAPFISTADPKNTPVIETEFGTSLAKAESLANSGRLHEAARLCERLLQAETPQAASYHLFGLIQEALGRKDTAEDYHRKALFLDPHHPGALRHLALIREQQGDLVSARRLRQRAQRACASTELQTTV